jgi:hypothetical protein
MPPLLPAAAAQLHNSNISSSTISGMRRCRCTYTAGAVQAIICGVAQLPACAAALHHEVRNAMAWHVAAAAHQRAVSWQVAVLPTLQQQRREQRSSRELLLKQQHLLRRQEPVNACQNIHVGTGHCTS